jgi:hypothetical protein
MMGLVIEHARLQTRMLRPKHCEPAVICWSLSRKAPRRQNLFKAVAEPSPFDHVTASPALRPPNLASKGDSDEEGRGCGRS